MALAASGKGLALREGESSWEVSSGQYALPLNAAKSATVSVLVPAKFQSLPLAEAEAHYARGHALEESDDVAAARAAYLDALNAHNDHVEARINLGRLLHLDGELREAEKVYRAARTARPATWRK